MGVFSERLKEAMVSQRMTQVQLAATVGIGKSSISQYLSGRNVPNSANLKQIAEALDVSADWLSGKADEVNPIRNLPVEDAAKLMGVGKQCIRQGLKNGNLPFGCAVKMPQGKYRYYITVLAAVIIGILALRFSSFRNWLVYAVSEAEKALGEKTGQLKLRYAYDLAIGAYPIIAKVIPWALFSWLVDKALEIMKAMINSNDYIAAVITNTESEDKNNE